VAPLVVLGVLAAVLATPAPSVRPVAHSVAGKPFCLVDTHIPDEAYAVEQFVRTHNFSPPPGLKSGKPYSPDHYSAFLLMFPPGCLVDPTRWIPRARLPGGGT
jgi:hypothetical protein